MDLPINVDTGTVVGRYIVKVIDGVDPNQEPDAVPVRGRIVFTASVPYLPDPSASPDPVTIMTAPIVGVLDEEGYLCTPYSDTGEPMYRGVKLAATDDPDLAVQNWTWDVTYIFEPVNGHKLAIPAHGFSLPSGETVDLTKVAKVPSSPGYSLPQAEAAVLRAEAIAQSIRDDADNGVFNGEAATVVVGTVTSGATPDVVNAGDEQHAILNFTLEKGDKGDTGTGVPDAGDALQVMRMDSAGVATEWVTPTKAIVGLSNVDNTADADKPISGPTELALGNKADLESGKVPETQIPERLSTAALSATIADQNAAQVPPLVASAIATDSTIAAAAIDAIQGAGLDAGFVPGEENPDDEFTVSFDDGEAFVRANESRGIHDTLIDGMFLEALPDDSEFVQMVSERDPATGVTRLIWGKRLDGSEYPGTVAPGEAGAATTYRATYETDEKDIVSGPAITLCGHSMAAGMFSELQAALPGVTLMNNTVGGETSRTVAWRQGGQPILLLPTTGTVPASGTVDVTLQYADGSPTQNGDWPMLQGASSYAGSLVIGGLKIPGTFSITRSPSASPATHHVDDTYQFTRSETGTAVVANRPHPFYTTSSESQRGNIFIYWVGRNNYTELDQVLSDIQAMIGHQHGLEKRFLILSEHAGEYPSEYKGGSGALALQALNMELRKLAGRRFVDSFKYLISYGLQDAGITATAGDNTDIANEIIPRSLRSDALHLKNAADTIVVALIVERLQEKGWL